MIITNTTHIVWISVVESPRKEDIHTGAGAGQADRQFTGGSGTASGQAGF